MLNKDYEPVFLFESMEQAVTALRALSEVWVTGKSGRHGGNKKRQHHAGPRGCFLVTVDAEGVATLHEATDNAEPLPDTMDGATLIEEEDEVNDIAGAIDLVVAPAGKSVAEIKKMNNNEKTKHAKKCAEERVIKGPAVLDVAKKLGCPADNNTKYKRLLWMFLMKCI